ncbi:M28 family peptidase [Streptomyces sp. NBC_01262]|uniref:M28 family peptidase n=1 Tax=Streptomyces sp. NBC_01262 TaxID=2903803 RepID=UPI002E36AA22|nr:M28 family peptidase [Streptomyces sp. NBC_01262]
MDDDHHDGLKAALEQTVRSLAGIPRLPASRGEAHAAELIRRRFEAAGCTVRVDPEPAYHSYAQPIGLLCAAGAAAGLLAGRGGTWRAAGALVGSAAAWGIVDDITGGRLLARRMLMRPRTTQNVIAETGDPKADRTLVVLVHHDAAPSGVVFEQHLEHWLAARHPEVIEKMTSNPPMWWPVIAGPALVGLGSALRIAALRRLGVWTSVLSAAALADIATRPAVPGANDNLSGIAVAIAVAEALAADPVQGIRVRFVSAGAEEALQQGILGFARRHFGRLAPDRTWFLNLDTVGSGRLVLLEGEGPVRMHDYDASFKALVADCADQAGVTVLRGLRSRNSTDGSVPQRHGYPTATLVSVDSGKLLPNYHLYTDIPDNVDYTCVAGAVRLTEAVARRLA